MNNNPNRKTVVAVTIRGSSFANDPSIAPRRLTKSPTTSATTLVFRTHRVCHTVLP